MAVAIQQKNCLCDAPDPVKADMASWFFVIERWPLLYVKTCLQGHKWLASVDYIP